MEQEQPLREINFNEADVQRVAAAIEAKPEASAETADTTSKEQVRQALVAVLPQPIPAVAPVNSGEPLTEAAQQRVDILVGMASAEGIDAAHAKAMEEEPYVLDAFHDALAGALYDQLKQQGKL